jgi:hypothetical protein
MRARGLRSATALAATALLLALPQAGLAASGSPQLGADAAVRMMRTVLVREFGEAWRQARGHTLDCPVAVHPVRGGHGQDDEIRRRCFFSWTSGETRYAGKGLIWLGGRLGDGSRHWSFHFFSTETTGRHVKTFNQSGQVQPFPF